MRYWIFVRKIENILLYLFLRVYGILFVFYVGLFGRTEYIYVCANVNPIILGYQFCQFVTVPGTRRIFVIFLVVYIIVYGLILCAG